MRTAWDVVSASCAALHLDIYGVVLLLLHSVYRRVYIPGLALIDMLR